MNLIWELLRIRKNPLDQGYWTESQLRGQNFGAIGKNVRIARNATVIGTKNVFLGDNVRIDGFSTLIAAGGQLRVGDYVHIGGSCHVNASAGVSIGSYSTLSQGVRLYSASDDFSGEAMTNSTVPAELKKVKTARVDVGDHVVVGSGSVILPGSILGEGVAVGALSLVTGELQPWRIFAGVPLRDLKARSQMAKELSESLRAEKS